MDVPPKILRREADALRREADREDGLPALRGAELPVSVSTSMEKLDPEQLPVLAAFQTFLEGDRKSTRRRLTAITLLFSVLFVSGIAGVVALALVFFGQLEGDFQDLREDVTGVRTSAHELQQQTASTLLGLRRDAEGLKQEIALRQQRLSGLESNVESRASVYGVELAELRTLLERVRLESDELAADIETLKSAPQPASLQTDPTIPGMTGLELATAERPLERIEPAIPSPPAAAPEPTSLAPQPGDHTPDTIASTLVRSGAEEPVRWWMPVTIETE